MRKSIVALCAAFAGSAMLAGCNPGSTTVAPHPTPVPTRTPPSSGTPTPTPSPTPVPTPTGTPTPVPTGSNHPTPTPTPTATAQPQVVHIGFSLTPEKDPTFGPIAFYAPTLSPPHSAIITVKSGSQLVFLNDGTPSTQHTASLLGTSGFPPSGFGSNNPFNQTGNVVGSTFWSTGILNFGSMSQAFTIGAPGDYYFGCGFHYGGSPSMQDVIVSQ